MLTAWATRRQVLALAAAGMGVLVLTTACGKPAQGGTTAAGSHRSAGPAVTIDGRTLPSVGRVLVTSNGYALYMFVPDDRRQVTCTGLCASTWPPVKITPDAQLAAGPGVQAHLLGSDPDPAGGRVVTYNGWPLYTYTGDVQPGQVTGQGIDLNGGDWYLMRPSGQVLNLGPAG
jgi:predicted lipoprotein with Yx(FWY)xxD motif